MKNDKKAKNEIKKIKFEKKTERVEPKYFVRDLAKNFNVSSFDFLILKRENNLEDTSSITTTEFRQMYQKIIEGR